MLSDPPPAVPKGAITSNHAIGMIWCLGLVSREACEDAALMSARRDDMPMLELCGVLWANPPLLKRVPRSGNSPTQSKQHALINHRQCCGMLRYSDSGASLSQAGAMIRSASRAAIGSGRIICFRVCPSRSCKQLYCAPPRSYTGSNFMALRAMGLSLGDAARVVVYAKCNPHELRIMCFNSVPLSALAASIPFRWCVVAVSGFRDMS